MVGHRPPYSGKKAILRHTIMSTALESRLSDPLAFPQAFEELRDTLRADRTLKTFAYGHRLLSSEERRGLFEDTLQLCRELAESFHRNGGRGRLLIQDFIEPFDIYEPPFAAAAEGFKAFAGRLNGELRQAIRDYPNALVTGY